jgi:ribosome-associated translation inhibitor RaiA
MQTYSTQTQSVETSTNEIYFPYDISFVDCEPSDAVRFQVEHQLTKLSRIHNRITDCRVIIRIPHKHRMNSSRIFHIHISLDLPGKRLAVSREPELNDERSGIQTAISASFHKLIRQLEDFVKARKAHL